MNRSSAINFNSVLIKIIEEISDGFLIIDQDNELLFFNEVLLRLLKWRSMEMFARKKELLQVMDLKPGDEIRRRIVVNVARNEKREFDVTSFVVQTLEGAYTLVRMLPVEPARPDSPEYYRVQYRELFFNVREAFYTADTDGNIITANPSFYDFIGYSPEECPANMRDLLAYPEDFNERLALLKESSSYQDENVQFFTKDGFLKKALESAWVVRNREGYVESYSCHVKDLTYVRNIESRLLISERNFRILFDTILSSIIICDPLGHILNLNFAAESSYGYSWNDVISRHYDDVFRGGMTSPSFAKIKTLIDRNGGKYTDPEVHRKDKAGKDVYTYASYSVIKDSSDEVLAYSIVEKDLTERVHLEQKLQESFNQLKEAQSAAILGFAKLTEFRDKGTGKHLERMREYARVLVTKLKDNPKYANYITDSYIEDIYISATLHDVGKVGVEDHILLKEGPLTDEEYEKIKEHVKLGGRALAEIDVSMDKRSFLTIGKEIAYYHHEKWDGTGYPEGRKGEHIPLSARIVAIADVYDALTSERSYKKAYTHEEAVRIITEESGKHFDPEIVQVFLANHEVFQRIKRFVEFEEHPESIVDLLSGTAGDLGEH
ncbi:MAG: PAS domain S-box protein [Spirochaetales bacterium]|nr:PAS domain S-box protein [Spirochaetales bacterium]